MTPALRATGLRAGGADGTPVVDGVGLELRAGEVVALLGANGSGKTTLMRMLAGVLAPDAGAIELAGGADPAARGHAAYLPQLARPVRWRDAVGNAALPLEAGGLDRRTARTVAAGVLASDEPGLLRRGGRRGHGLSGGERQRLLLAGVLALERPIVLLDEPFAAVDAAHRAVVGERLRRVAAAGRAVLVVTHEPADAARFADRIVVLGGRPGRVVAIRTPPPAGRRDPRRQGAIAADLLSLVAEPRA